MSRRARQMNDLKRNRAKQASYDRVLIVCEGSKTEPNYFREIIDHLKLTTANVEVDGSSDSSPRSVVAHAIQRLQDDPDFDRVYGTTLRSFWEAESGRLRHRGSQTLSGSL